MKISRDQLKIIALISMICDHTAAACLDSGCMAYIILRNYIGRIAFPIFCILMVEGFIYTKRPKTHIRDLLIFGLISEIGYDLATSHSFFDFKSQNTIFSWFISFLCLFIIDKIINSKLSKLNRYGYSIAVSYIFMIIAYFICLDYSFVQVLIPCGLYMYFKIVDSKNMPRNMFIAGLFVSAILILIYRSYGALLSIPFLILYDQKSRSKLKYLFYIAYPVHLYIVGLIGLFLRRL